MFAIIVGAMTTSERSLIVFDPIALGNQVPIRGRLGCLLVNLRFDRRLESSAKPLNRSSSWGPHLSSWASWFISGRIRPRRFVVALAGSLLFLCQAYLLASKIAQLFWHLSLGLVPLYRRVIVEIRHPTIVQSGFRPLLN